jgi:hypothetical protein
MWGEVVQDKINSFVPRISSSQTVENLEQFLPTFPWPVIPPQDILMNVIEC